MVGGGLRHHDSRGLWELDWLHVPSAATSIASPFAFVASATGSFQQWHHRLGYLGSVSGDVSLECQGCRLGIHIQLPYPTSESVSRCPFDLIHSDVWGRLPSL